MNTKLGPIECMYGTIHHTSHEIHPHIITEPPPNFTVWLIHSGKNSSPALLLTYTLPSDPKRLNLEVLVCDSVLEVASSSQLVHAILPFPVFSLQFLN